MRIAVLVVAATLAVAATVHAQSAPPAPAATGKISGKITSGKESIGLANITIPALKVGTMSDENGNFVLSGVPVGTHALQVSAIGYDKKMLTVVVQPGVTATANVVLGEAKTVKELETIEVRAQQKIDLKSSQTKHTLTAEKLKELPVDNLQAAVGTRAGVIAQGGELHFRGGRAGEIKLTVDGVEATDPLVGRSANVASISIAGAEVLTGGIDAEHGNALSGFINVTTKEGSDTFGGEVRWDTDRYGDPTKTFNNFDRFTFGMGGPTSVKDLTWFATYEGTFSDTHLKSSLTRPERTLFDFITLGNRQFNQINTNLKFAYKINPRHKVTLETINNRTINTAYNHMWSRKGFVSVTYDTISVPGQPDRYDRVFGSWSAFEDDSTFQPVNMADHVPTVDDRFQQLTSVWTHQLSENTVWTTRASYLAFKTLSTVGGKQPWEYDTQSPFYWQGNTVIGSENNLFYATHGDFPAYFRSNASTYTLKSDLASRRWRQHAVKTGIELKYNRVENLALALPNAESGGLPGGARSDYTNYNPEGAAYVQDRWEFEGLVLNAGVRYDVFTPGDQISDLDLRSGKRYKQQFSPRLGIAYPISDKDVLSFHYGWTYQTPARNVIFQNRGVNSTVAIRGNPDLEPETNIAYQAGMQHLFSRDVSGQFSVFFRDIFGLITTRQQRDEFGNLVNAFFNGDYASSRGVEASLTKSFSHKFSADINYTYSIATGVASNPNEALQFFNGGRLFLPISERALDWDQRNTLSVSANVRDQGRWGFRVLWTYGSGFPFSPSFRNDRRPDPVLQNSRRLPSASNLTIDGDKFYKVWGQSVWLFFDARNVLDAKNVGALTQNTFPNPFINNSGDEYLIYYTETGRAGGAYLQDTNGDGVLDWVPIRDPRVFDEGRNVRVGASITF